jgi:kynurenine formamidase
MDHAQATLPLWNLYSTLLAKARFTDLTHAFFPDQPHFPAFPNEVREKIFTVPEHGFEVTRYTLVGQWGTHVDAPSHFVDGGRSLDAIPVEQMLLPLVVLDITARVAENPDTTSLLSDVHDWESRHGRIPDNAFVALRSGWSARWPDADAFANKDSEGVAHYPGWSREVLEFFIQSRNVTAIGHEVTDTDPGTSTSKGDYSVEAYWLGQDRWQIELMANLADLPDAGALLWASWPKPLAGSGYPARLVAIQP